MGKSKFRINEALALSEAKGKKVFKKELASKMFPGVSEQAQQVNLSGICSGKTKRILPEWVDIICSMCDCTPNFLFGYEET